MVMSMVMSMDRLTDIPMEYTRGRSSSGFAAVRHLKSYVSLAATKVHVYMTCIDGILLYLSHQRDWCRISEELTTT